MNIKNNKGSVTLYVLLAFLFFLSITIGTYVSVRNREIKQDEEIASIQKRYEQQSIDLTEIKRSVEIQLPEEYQQVEYIESTGTQYIDTGVTPDNTTNIEITYKSPNNNINYQRIFGQSSNVGNNRFQIEMNNTNKASWNLGIGGRVSSISMDASSNFKTFKFKSGVGAYIDGELSLAMSNTETNSYNIWLFRGYDKYSAIQISACKIWKSNKLVRSFIPCYRKSDKVVGLYDIVNNVFYENAGTGNFKRGKAVGDNVKDCILSYNFGNEVTFDGSSYIDTDLKLFSESEVNRDYEISLNIDNFEPLSGQNENHNSIINSKDESRNDYLGFVFRYHGSYTKYNLSANSNSSVKTNKYYEISSIQDVSIVRRNNILYFNDENILDYSEIARTFDVPLTFGASIKNAQPFRYFKGTLSDIMVKAIYESTEDVTLTSPTRTKYTFMGWNTKADGTGTTYAAGSTIRLTSNLTLYAQWTENNN